MGRSAVPGDVRLRPGKVDPSEADCI